MSYQLRQALKLASARALEQAARLQALTAEAVELSALLARALDADRRETALDLADMASSGADAKVATPRPKTRRPRKPLTVEDVDVGTSGSRRK